MGSITSKKGNSIPKRTIVIKDKTSELPLTLWYKGANAQNITLYSVIGITSAMVNVFRNQISISTKHCAYRILKPVGDTYYDNVKQWYAR